MAADPLNSKGGFSTGIPANTVIQANGQITTSAGANVSGNIILGNINSTANANVLSNIFIAGDGNLGRVLGVDSNNRLRFQSTIGNGTSVITVMGNSNVTISAGNVANVATFYGTGSNSGLILNRDLAVEGNATIDGNLNVLGNTNFTSVNNLSVSEPFIDLAVNGAGGPLINSDNFDRGLVFHFFGANLVTTANANVDITSTPTATITLAATDFANIEVGQAVYGNIANGDPIFPANTVVANVDLANLQITANVDLIANVTEGDQVVFGSDRLNFSGFDQSTNTYVFVNNVSIINNIVTYDSNANSTQFMNVRAGTVTATLDGNIVRANANLLIEGNGNVNLNTADFNSIITTAGIEGTVELVVGARGNVILSGGANSNFRANVTTVDFKTSNISNISLGNVSNLHIDGGATTAASLGAITLDANGVVTDIAIGSGGSGYDIAPIVTVTGSNSNVATVTAVLGTGNNAGRVVSLNIDNGGANYSNASVSATITAPGIKYLKTDGTGNLAWREVSAVSNTSAIANAQPAGSNTQVQFNDNGQLGANVNFTYNKTTRTLSVPNISSNGSNIQLGNIGNIHITGGNSGQFIQTNGNGNLIFANGTVQAYANIVYNRVNDTYETPVNINEINIGSTQTFLVTTTWQYSDTLFQLSANALVGDATVLVTGNIESNVNIGNFITLGTDWFSTYEVTGITYTSGNNTSEISITPTVQYETPLGFTIWVQTGNPTPPGSTIAFIPDGEVLTVTSVSQVTTGPTGALGVYLDWTPATTQYYYSSLSPSATGEGLYQYVESTLQPVEVITTTNGIQTQVDVANKILNLSVQTPSFISNATSNVTIPTANGNVNININGNAIANVSETGINSVGLTTGPFSVSRPNANSTNYSVNLGNVSALSTSNRVFVTGAAAGQVLSVVANGAVTAYNSNIDVIVGYNTGFSNTANAFVSNAVTAVANSTSSTILVTSPNSAANISALFPLDTLVQFSLDSNGNTVSNTYYSIAAISTPNSNTSVITIQPGLVNNVIANSVMFRATIAQPETLLQGNNITIDASNVFTDIAQINVVPSGNTGAVQYNAAGVLGGSANFSFDTSNSNNRLSVTNVTVSNSFATSRSNVTDVANFHGIVTFASANISNTNTNSQLIFSGNRASFSNISNLKVGGTQLSRQVITTDGNSNLRFANATLYTDTLPVYTEIPSTAPSPSVAVLGEASVISVSSVKLTGDWYNYSNSFSQINSPILDPVAATSIFITNDYSGSFPSGGTIRIGSNTGNAVRVDSASYQSTYTTSLNADIFPGDSVIQVTTLDNSVNAGIPIQIAGASGDALPPGTYIDSIDFLSFTITLSNPAIDSATAGSTVTLDTNVTLLNINPATPVTATSGEFVWFQSDSKIPTNGATLFALGNTGTPFTLSSASGYSPVTDLSDFYVTFGQSPGDHSIGTELFYYTAGSLAPFEKVVEGAGINLSVASNILTITNTGVSSIANGNSNIRIYTGNVTISANGQANIFDIQSNGTYAETIIQDDVTVTGNLNVSGNTNFINVNELAITNPLIQLGIYGNGSPLTTNDGKDRGVVSHIYGANLVTEANGNFSIGTTVITLDSVTGIANGLAVFANDANLDPVFPDDAVVSNVDVANSQITVSNATIQTLVSNTQVIIGSDRLEFMGWKASNAEFQTRSNVTQSNQIISGGQYANLRSNYFKGNVYNDTANLTLGANGNPTIVTLASNSAIFTANVVSVGSNSNLKISGGSNAFYLQTDSLGNLRWSEGTLHSTTEQIFTTANIELAQSISVGGVLLRVPGDIFEYSPMTFANNPITTLTDTTIGGNTFFVANLPSAASGVNPIGNGWPNNFTVKLGANGNAFFGQLIGYYLANGAYEASITLDVFDSIIPAGTQIYGATSSNVLSQGNVITFGEVLDSYTIDFVGPYYSSLDQTSVAVNRVFSNNYSANTEIYYFTDLQYYTQIVAGNGISSNIVGNALVIDSNAVSNTIFNGNSNVIVDANSLVRVSVNGVANVSLFDTTGLVAPANKSVSFEGNNGTDVRKVSIVASSSNLFTANYTLTLPVNDGNVGQVLSTDGTGVLSWRDGTSLSNGSSNITIDANEAIRISANGLANVFTVNNNVANFSAPIVNIDSQGYTGWVNADATANYDRGIYLGNVNQQIANTAVTYPVGTSNISLAVTGNVTENWTGFNIGDKFFVNSDAANIYTVTFAYEKYLEFTPASVTTIANNDTVQGLTSFFGYKGDQAEFVAVEQGNISNLRIDVASYANVRANVFKGAIAANTITANSTVTLSNVVNITGNFNYTGANARFSNVSNVHILGGAANYFLRTDGAGNLSWAYITPTSASIPNVHFDVPSNGNNQSFSNAVLGNYPANTDMTIFRNGSLLTSDNYTLTGSVLTINVPLIAGDNIDIIRQGLITISNSILIANYAAIPTVEFIAAANGNNQVFSNNFLRYYSSNLDLNLFVNGAIQQTENYTLDVATGNLTFNLPLQTGDSIIIPNKLANVSNLANGVAGSNTQVLYNDEDTVNASPAFTFTKTSNTVNVINITANGVANLGAVGNVKITGGTANFFLQTDGTGNLTWADVVETGLVNGNSNITVLANSNITMSSNGQANIIVISSNSTEATTTIANTLVVTGNITGNGTISANGNLSATGSANIGGNITANGTITANGNVTTANLLVNGDANITGNLTVGGSFNIAGVANGNSNVRVFANSDVTVSTAGNANVFVVSANGNVTATRSVFANTITANSGITSNANITATANVSANNVNATNTVLANSVVANANVSATGNVLANVNVVANANVSAGNNVLATGNVIATQSVLANVNVVANANISASNNITAGGNITAAYNITGNTLNIVGTGVRGTGGAATINGDLTIGNAIFQQGGNVTASYVSANAFTNREQGTLGDVQVSYYNRTAGLNNITINFANSTTTFAGNIDLINNQANWDSFYTVSGVGSSRILDFTMSNPIGTSVPPVFVAIGGSTIQVSNDGNNWWPAAANANPFRPTGFSTQWQSVGRGGTNGNTFVIVATDTQLWYSNNRANSWYQASTYFTTDARKVRGSLTGQFVVVGANGNIATPTTFGNYDSWSAVLNLGSSVVFNQVATNDNGVWVAGGYYTGNGIGVLYRSVDDGNTWSIDTRANTDWPAYANAGIAISYDTVGSVSNTFIIMGGRSRSNNDFMEIRQTSWNGSAWTDDIVSRNFGNSITYDSGWSGVVKNYSNVEFDLNVYYMTSYISSAIYTVSDSPLAVWGPVASLNSQSGNIMRLTSANGIQFTSNTMIAAGNANVWITQEFDANLSVGNNLTVAGDANIAGNLSTTGNLIGNVRGNIFNGNSNVRIAANGNVTISSDGVANILTIDGSNNRVTVTGNLVVSNNTILENTLQVNNDAVITGNLTVLGNAIYNDTSSLVIQDPVIELGTGNNDTVLTSADVSDRGLVYHSYGTGMSKVNSAQANSGSNVIPIANTVGIVEGMFIGTPDAANIFNHLSTVVTINTNSNVIISNVLLNNLPINSNLAIGNDLLRFEGWDTSTNEFTFGSNVDYDQATNIITYNQYGNLRFDTANANSVGKGNSNTSYTLTTASLNSGTSNVVVTQDSKILVSSNGVANLFTIDQYDAFESAWFSFGNPNARLQIQTGGNAIGNYVVLTRTTDISGGISTYFNDDGSLYFGNGSALGLQLYANNIVRQNNATEASSYAADSGAFRVAGGVSIAKSLYVGNNLNTNANLSVVGNITANNANISNNVVIGNTLTVTGNITGNANIIGNFDGNVYAGNSNVRLLANSNVSISANGNANILLVEGGVTSNVYISGNLQVNANIIANFNGNLYAGNSNVRLAANGNVSISANGDANVLVVSGNDGASDVSTVTIGNDNTHVDIIAESGSANFILITRQRELGTSNTARIAMDETGTMYLGNIVIAEGVSIDGNNITTFSLDTDATTSDGTTGAVRVLGGISANKSVYVGGNLQATGNVTAKGAANGVQYSNSGNLNSTANFTFDGSNLAFTGATANLGNAANVKLLGATANGQLLSADINGNLAFVDPSSVDKIANGTSNIYIPAANGNAYVTIGGNANIVTFYDSGVVIGNAANAVINTTLSDGNITTGGNVIVGNAGNAVINTTLANGNITTGGNITVGTVSGTAANTDKSVNIRSTNTGNALVVSSNTANATLSFSTGNGSATLGQNLDVGTVTGTAADYSSNARILSTTNATSPTAGALIVTADTSDANLSVAFGNGNAYIGGALQVGIVSASAAQSTANVRVYSTTNATAANAGAVVVTSNIANADVSIATGNGNVFVGASLTLGRVTTNVAQTNSNIMVYSNVDVTDTQTGGITITSNNANANLSTAIGNGKVYTGIGVQSGFLSGTSAVGAATMYVYSNVNATNANASGALRITSDTSNANLSIAMGNGNAFFGTSVTVGNSTAGGAGVAAANLRVLSNVNATAPATGALVIAGNTANANLAVAFGNGNAYIGGNVVVGTASAGNAVNSSNITLYSNSDTTASNAGAMIISANTAEGNVSTAIGNGKISTGTNIQVGRLSSNVAVNAANILVYSNVNSTTANVGAFIVSGNTANGNLSMAFGNGNAYIGGNLEVGTASANLGAAVNSSRLYIYSNINAANLATAGFGAFTVGGNLANANLVTTVGNGNVYTGGNLQVGTGLNSDANAAVNASKLTVISNINSSSSIVGGFVVTGNAANVQLSTAIGNGNIRTGGMLVLGNVNDSNNLLYISARNTTGPNGSTNYAFFYGGNSVQEFRMGSNAVNPTFTFGTLTDQGFVANGNVGFTLQGTTTGNATLTAVTADPNANLVFSSVGAGNVLFARGNVKIAGNAALANQTVFTDQVLSIGANNLASNTALGIETANTQYAGMRLTKAGNERWFFGTDNTSANGNAVIRWNNSFNPLTITDSANSTVVITRSGNTANATAGGSDNYLYIGGYNAGNASVPVSVGIQSSNSTYSGIRWTKAANSEVVYLGTDSTSNTGNVILNTNLGGLSGNTVLRVSPSALSSNVQGYIVSLPAQLRRYEATKIQANVTPSTNYAIAWDNVIANTIPGLIHSGGTFTNYGPQRKLQFTLQVGQLVTTNNLAETDIWFTLNDTGAANNQARFGQCAEQSTTNTSKSWATSYTFVMNTNDTVTTFAWCSTAASNWIIGAAQFGMGANYSSRITVVEVV